MTEQVEAKRDGARLQKNSGRSWNHKGDGVWEGDLVDYKDANKSFTLNMRVWSKVCTDAIKVGRWARPILKITLGAVGEAKVRLGIVEWEYLTDLKRKARIYDECETCQTTTQT